MSFAHLHLHTKYSILDGAIHIDKLTSKLQELGMDTCAITDHRTMSGILEFHREMKKANLKPIIGMEIEIALADCRVKTVENKDTFHLVLLCTSNTGYQNLKQISTKANLVGFYYKPRIDHVILEQHAEGLVALSGCRKGLVPSLVAWELMDTAAEQTKKYLEMFDSQYYLEIQENGIIYEMDEGRTISQHDINHRVLEIAEATGASVVATNDCHYLSPEDQEIHDLILAIQTNQKLSDQSRFRFDSDQLYLKSEEEMREQFSYYEQAVDNAGWLAGQIKEIDIEMGVTHFPIFNIEEADDYEAFIQEQSPDPPVGSNSLPE